MTFVAQRLNTAGSNKLTSVDACLFLYVKTETDIASETLCMLYCILICLKIYDGEKSKIQIVLNSGSMLLGTLVLACQTAYYHEPEEHNRKLQ